MKLCDLYLLSFASSLTAASAIGAVDEVIPAGGSITYPRSISLLPRKERKKDNWGNAVEKDRKKLKIRASKNDSDDISDDFLWALKQANNGGLVQLEKNHKYVIGKKLDLTFLKDIYVNIEGELKVS